MTPESKSPSASILLFGEDLRLVETRRWVLEKAGYRLRTALCLNDVTQIAAAEPIQLFLLCDSLLPTARDQALALLRSNWPKTRCLVLTHVGDSADLSVTETPLPAIEGPRKLIAVIGGLIGRSEPSVQSTSHNGFL